MSTGRNSFYYNDCYRLLIERYVEVTHDTHFRVSIKKFKTTNFPAMRHANDDLTRCMSAIIREYNDAKRDITYDMVNKTTDITPDHYMRRWRTYVDNALAIILCAGYTLPSIRLHFFARVGNTRRMRSLFDGYFYQLDMYMSERE